MEPSQFISHIHTIQIKSNFFYLIFDLYFRSLIPSIYTLENMDNSILAFLSTWFNIKILLPIILKICPWAIQIFSRLNPLTLSIYTPAGYTHYTYITKVHMLYILIHAIYTLLINAIFQQRIFNLSDKDSAWVCTQ